MIKTRALGLALGLLFVAGTARAEAPLVFSEHGFSIAMPEGRTDQAVQQVVTLMLPASDGFGPNVNVQVQPYTGTIDEYIALSKKQLGALKIVREEKVGKDQVIFETTGAMQGHELHTYARGFAVGGKKVILATAVALETQWPKVGATLRKSVDSLKVTK